jgi:hypothetical protein
MQIETARVFEPPSRLASLNEKRPRLSRGRFPIRRTQHWNDDGPSDGQLVVST